jgi:hypothetical protein
VARPLTTAPAIYAHGRFSDPAVVRKNAFRAGLRRCWVEVRRKKYPNSVTTSGHSD